jgi:glycosyltransferase involved in cell wall biosynthesis
MHILIPALHRPSNPTGVCRHAANLAQCLSELNTVTKITLIVGEWQTHYFEKTFKLSNDKIKLLSVSIKNTSLSRNWWFLFGLPRLAGYIRADLIHLSFPFPVFRQSFNAPIISSIHDLYPYECPENFGYPQVWFNQLFLWQCIHNSDGLSCVSQCTLESLKQYFPDVERNKRTAVIYNIVDFAGINSKRPHQIKSDISFPFLLTVAQHRKNKNLALLIKVYNFLLNQGDLKPDTQLLIVGSTGPETKYLEELVQNLKLDESVLFLSGLEDAELYWLYDNASLFVIPSSTEGFCLPLAEALTLSCPTVCSDIPIFREVGALGCRYFQLDERAFHNLAEAILFEISYERSQSGTVKSQFSKKEVSLGLLNLYETLAGP